MIIRREALSAVLPAVTSDDTRYGLSRVRIEPSGRVVATNGHVLLMADQTHAFPDEDFPFVPGAPFHGTPETAIHVDANTIKALIAATAKKATIPILQAIQVSRNGSDKTVTLSATDLSAPRVATVRTDEEIRYPEYARVIPADSPERPTVKVSLSVEVLETLIKAAKAVQTDKRTKIVELEIPIGRKDRSAPCQATGSNRPGEVISAVKVRIPGKGSDVDVHGVAMPCRM